MKIEEWIAKAEAELHRRLGPPGNQVEARNMREWAVSLAENGGEDSFFALEYSPEDAVEEDLSYT